LNLLRSASVFAVPSFQENFGLAALEALACGVPVVAARGVNLSPAIEHAGAGWITRHPDELASTLVEVTRDEVGRRRRATSARKLAATYTWGSVATQLEMWYSALTPSLAALRGR
jgi:glycosyltransferase involved in cell wall biosynthesis